MTGKPERIIVIGASAGGIAALTTLIGSFEPSWPASVFITVHIGRNFSRLADILHWNASLPVRFAKHGSNFRAGVCLAPADRHLTIGETKTFLSAGPKENHTRPGIDPMFRSQLAITDRE